VKIAIRLKDAAFEFDGEPTDGPAIFPLAEKWIEIVREQGAASNAELHAAVAELKQAADAQRAAQAANQ
jgi:hypothetical protein